MKFQWFGASHFLITTDSGVRIAVDPFQNNDIVDHEPLPPYGTAIRPTYTGEADVVVMSHGDGDHSYIWNIQGVPRLYAGGGPQEYKGVRFSSVLPWLEISSQALRDTIWLKDFFSIQLDFFFMMG